MSVTANGGVTGYCTTLCCDGDEGQQTCYDEDYNPSYCSFIADGGCPCLDDQIKCGATPDWAGYCTELCCHEDEETCYDTQGNRSCNKRSLGGCSSHTSYEYWNKARGIASTILTKGSGSQVSYYAAIKSRKAQLLMAGSTTTTSEEIITHVIKSLEAEEAALFHVIRLKEESRVKSKKKNLAKGMKKEEEVTSIL